MKKLFILLLLCVAGNSFAQIKLEGFVKDSIGNPLELANVIAINQTSNALESYAITNNLGRYKLNLGKNASYKIQISYIGMKTSDDIVTTKEADIDRNFTLQYDNSLDEIQLIYEMPVTIKGDTITYNADSFNKGTERKLGDVLKNLPGVEVNADGEIEIEGKKVTKVMVDGKDFFDGDSKLATKNIPANAIDKVQVLKNYAEVGQLSGVTNNQDNIAINIKLKEGKTNFWFGDVTAGGGIADSDGLYLVQPKLFYYSPKYSINLIGDLNNIGEIAFSRRDYFNFTGGFRRPSMQSGTNISLGNNDLGFLTLQNNKAKDINTKFGAANFSYSPKKTLDISGFGIISSSKTILQENRFTQYTDSDLGIPDETTESNTLQRSDLGMMKFSAKYKPNANNQMDYDILGRMSKESQDQNFLSSVIGNIDQFEESSPFSINQNLNYYYTLNDKNIFAFSAQHLWQDEDPFYNALLVNDPTNNNNPIDPNDNLPDPDAYDLTALGLGLDRSLDNYDVAQNKRVKTNQLDAKLDYWNVLNAKSNINFTLGTILSTQKFDSDLFQFLDDGSIFNPTPLINDGLDSNSVEYNFSDAYLGAHYQFKSGIFTITPGVSAHAYSAKNTQLGTTYTDNFFRLLPDFNTRIQLKKSEQIIFNYRMQTQFTDINQLAEGLVMNSYNRIFSGNRELQSAVSHNVNLSYFSFNMFNYTNVFANINYNKSIDNIRTSSTFESGSVVNVSSPFNSNFADETLSASGRFQRSFGKIRASVNGNFNYAKFNQFIQNQRSVNENYTQNYGAEVRSNFKDAPNFEVGYRYTIQDNDLGSTRTTFFTHAPRVELDAYIWKAVTFRTNFTYESYSNDNQKLNSYEFWDASLSYRKDKDAKLEYQLKATNLLDTKSQNQTNSNNISVSATEYFIQPRYVTFRMIYSL